MITIVLPISRQEYLRPVFNCLAELLKAPDTELLIITDGDADLEKAVDKRLDSLSFQRIQVINFGDKPAVTRDERRYRISEIHNWAKNFVAKNCEYVMLIEDDTTYPKDTLEKMCSTMETLQYGTGFVEGVELGRRNTPYIGGWICDDIDNPTEIKSVMPGDETITAIDAGGLYCCLVDYELYKTHHFQPFDAQGQNGLSCDLNFGLWMSRRGYVCIIDWSIQCDHIGEKGSVNMGNTKPVQVVFEKYNNKWSARTI